MSETGEQYRVSGLPEGPRSVTLLPYHAPGFVTPTDIGMRALTQRHALTGSALARITGVSPRTVRKGHAPPEVEHHSPVPYAAWRLLLIETGTVAPIGLPVLLDDLAKA